MLVRVIAITTSDGSVTAPILPIVGLFVLAEIFRDPPIGRFRCIVPVGWRVNIHIDQQRGRFNIRSVCCHTVHSISIPHLHRYPIVMSGPIHGIISCCLVKILRKLAT
jgi:hypothetical protein